MQASNPPLWSVPRLLPPPPASSFPFQLEPTSLEPPVRSFGVGIFQAFSKGRWWGVFPHWSSLSEARQALHPILPGPEPCPTPSSILEHPILQGLSALGHSVSLSSWAGTSWNRELECSRFHILLLTLPSPPPAPPRP